MNMEDGWAKHLEADKKIGEEVEIERMIKEIQGLLLWRITLGVDEDDVQTSDQLKRNADYFIGHPERVAWLKSYLEESKAKMKAVVPGGDMGVLKNLEKLRTGFPGDDLVTRTAREIRDGFLSKDFEEEAKLTKSA
ncbi:MAG: hypothetical protein NTZ87_03810 [Candidatus Nomurabacteria bacterium]|nr:hypothetical protein [Candidatus Nomurabacteria bacterium]